MSLFHVTSRCAQTQARGGFLKTRHAAVETPIFMPVGTHGLVRTQGFSVLKDLGYQILLTNTYHLHLKPGADFFARFGDLKKFSTWGNAFLTDSGGFQIFCLPEHRRMSDEGAKFRSYIDGAEISFSPEVSIATQKAINSDIMMVLDECVPSTVDHPTAKKAMLRTHAWAKRSYDAHRKNPQGQFLFGIVQGACFDDLRQESAKVLSDMEFDGLAIGGLAVGESFSERVAMTGEVTQLLPKEKPRYLMGVGTPLDLIEAVALGVDMFDCILPTALSQQGVCFTSTGKVDLRKSRYQEDFEPIDKQCPCAGCQTYTRAYLRHLLKSQEFFVWQVLGEHNLTYYAGLMRQMRKAISEGTFSTLRQHVRDLYAATG